MADWHCPACPPLACNADQYNPFLGFSGDCQACPEPVGPGTFTSYAAAQQCDVERVDLTCDSDECECCVLCAAVSCVVGWLSIAGCVAGRLQLLPCWHALACPGTAAHQPLVCAPLACADRNSGKSWAYDLASQECQLCAAGTVRNYDGSTECEPW